MYYSGKALVFDLIIDNGELVEVRQRKARGIQDVPPLERDCKMNDVFLVVKAEYLGDLSVRLTFSDGLVRELDFTPFFKRNSHPMYNKYSDPKNFKKFSIEEGNIVWGKNWDLIFHLEELHDGTFA